MQAKFDTNLLIHNGEEKNCYNYWGKTVIYSFYIVAPLQTGRIEKQ